MAYNQYQISAGIFNQINEKFLHPPSVDLSRESISFLTDMMLMQAQEVLIEKILFEAEPTASLPQPMQNQWDSVNYLANYRILIELL